MKKPVCSFHLLSITALLCVGASGSAPPPHGIIQYNNPMVLPTASYRTAVAQ